MPNPENHTPEQETSNPTTTSKGFLDKWTDRLLTPLLAGNTGMMSYLTHVHVAHGDETYAIIAGVGAAASGASLIMRDTAMRLTRDGLQNQVNHLREQVNNYRDLLHRGRK
jgi:hypothetical protein